MIRTIRSLFPALLILGAVSSLGVSSAHAQFYKLKGASLSAGGIGQFTTTLTTNPTSSTTNVPTLSGGVLGNTVSGQQQFTTDSVGFLTQLQFHPRPWAGVELNYGFNHYSERYSFNYSSGTSAQTASVSTDAHEFTGAYEFHPRHIPFQPFLNIGGGAIDFTPRSASNQIRGAGLMETGFDIPTRNPHLAFRVEGRALVYRAPNFYTSAISTRSWRVTEEPSFSAVYRF